MIDAPAQIEISKYLLKNAGFFPNNKHLPVLFYQNAFLLSKEDPATTVEKAFAKNKWKNRWRDSIYHFHHYHSTAHEALGIYSGRVLLQLGGEDGPVLSVVAGDVVIIPAGVAHRNVESTESFRCVGAYPRGQQYDLNYGEKNELELASRNIQKLNLPETDPVFGGEGGLMNYWHLKRTTSRKNGRHKQTPADRLVF